AAIQNEQHHQRQAEGHLCSLSAQRLFARPIRDLPEGHRLAREPQVFASARTLHLSVGSPTRLAIHFRCWFPTSTRRVHHSSLSDLYPLRLVHYPRFDSDASA